MIILYFLASTSSSDEIDEEEEDTLQGRRERRDCGTSSLQLTDSDEQQMSDTEARKGGTPTFFRHSHTRKSNHKHYSSGYWKKRSSGGGASGSIHSSTFLPERSKSYASVDKGIHPAKTNSQTGSERPTEQTNDLEDESFQSMHREFDALPTNAINIEATKSRPKKASAGIESDSFNENFSSLRPNTKRKRKFKRMALDPETNPPATTNNCLITDKPMNATLTTEPIQIEGETAVASNFKDN